MAHGDDNGLVLPPSIAPIQIVIIPIPGLVNSLEYIEKVKGCLTNYRVEVDATTDETVGFKFNKWEIKGVPLRIEIGSREIEGSKVMLVRRDTGEKLSVALSDLQEALNKLSAKVQNDLMERHKKFTEENTRTVDSYADFKIIMETTRGYISAFWCEGDGCEEKIKAETRATTRCLPLDVKDESGNCVYCGKEAQHRWLFAQAY